MRPSPKWLSRLRGALRKNRPFVSTRKRDRISLHLERLEDRLTPAATVNGTVFLDFNANGVYDTTATIANAVEDALRPFGARINQLPVTPPRVVAAIAGRNPAG